MLRAAAKDLCALLESFSLNTVLAPEHPAGCSKSLPCEAAASAEAEAYFEPYVDPLSDARTKLVAFFNILLEHSFDRATRRRIEFPGNAPSLVGQTTSVNRILHRFRHGNRILRACNSGIHEHRVRP